MEKDDVLHTEGPQEKAMGQKALPVCLTVVYALTACAILSGTKSAALLLFLLYGIGFSAFYYMEIIRDCRLDSEKEPAGKEGTIEILPEEVAFLHETCLRQAEELAQYAEREASAKIPETDKPELTASLLPAAAAENPEPVNIISIAGQVLDELREYAAGSGILMQISSASDSIMLKADSDYIRLLFRNIVDNSIKYMQKEGILTLTISNVGDDIFIVLKDNGNGLKESETEHIFELNYQGSNRVSGNGLGLAQAKAIVDFFGGTIYAKSAPGKGMGIYIRLPEY